MSSHITIASRQMPEPRRRQPDQVCVAMRMANGLSARKAAAEAHVDPATIDEWLSEPAFQTMIRSCHTMMDWPDKERLQALEMLACDLIEIAMLEGDYRVAMFFYDQFHRGKNPARVLAVEINRQVHKAAKPATHSAANTSTTPATRCSMPPRWAAKPRRTQYNPWQKSLSAGKKRIRNEIFQALAARRRLRAHRPQTKVATNPNSLFVPSWMVFGDQPLLSMNGLLSSPAPNHPRDGP